MRMSQYKSVSNKISQLINNYHYVDFNILSKMLIGVKHNVLKAVLSEMIQYGIINISTINGHHYYHFGKTDSIIDGNSVADITYCLLVLTELKRYYRIKQHNMFPFPQTVKYIVSSKLDGSDEAYGEIMRLTESNLQRAGYMYHSMPQFDVDRIVVLDSDNLSLLEKKDYIEELFGPVKMYALVDDNNNITYKG